MQWPPGVLDPGERIRLGVMCLWSECPQQEYIAIDTKSNTSERYTWDSDHQPRYEDILAERMKSSETPGGLALNQAGAAGQRPRPERWLELSAGKRRNLRAGGQPAQRRHRADGEKRRRGGLR